MTTSSTPQHGLAIDISESLIQCPGLQAVVLGGSFATGTADTESDIDLGLYYDADSPLDLEELRRLVADIDDRRRHDLITGFGEWGAWVNGGGWLTVRSQRVDVLYRDLSRVAGAIDDCRAGRMSTHFQVGHPAGFSPQIYAGEIHLCRPLQDPHGAIAALKQITWPYPPGPCGKH